MVGGRPMAWTLALLCGVLAVGSAAAQGTDGPLPERRITVEPGVDLYGSDLRSIFGTTLPICRDACLAEAACTAFTFNTAASACFLKSDDGARTPFPAALSATLAPQPDGLAARAAARAADARLPAAGAARGGARGGALGGLPAGDPGRRGRRSRRDLAALRAEVNRTDAAAAWAALAGLRRRRGGRGLGASAPALRDLAVAAGINAFLRAGDRRRGRRGRPADRRRARGGRRGAGVARRAAPRRGARAGAGDRGRGGAGRGALRLSRRSTGRSTSRRRARAPASTFSEPLAGGGRRLCRLRPHRRRAASRSRRATASSASTGSRTAAATR